MNTYKKPFLFIIALMLFISCIKETEDNNLDNIERSYTKSIERIASNDFEADLIDQAEKYYPSRENVVSAAEWSGMEIPETKYWYYNSFDGVKIPFAITEDAINYYSDLIDEFNENPDDVFFYSANFEYKAEVTFYENYISPETDSQEQATEPESFDSVYVVKMALAWEDYCGSLCAAWINKDRIVVFNESGELLKVYLDGVSSVAVS